MPSWVWILPLAWTENKPVFPNLFSNNYFENDSFKAWIFLNYLSKSSGEVSVFASSLASALFSYFSKRSLILCYRLISLGCPIKSILPYLSTKKTKGMPWTLKFLIRGCSPSHPKSVKCSILFHPLLLTLCLIVSFSSSTLTATILTLPFHFYSFFSSISWLCCIGFWQGPHHVAQTSTSRTSPGWWTISADSSEKTLWKSLYSGILIP